MNNKDSELIVSELERLVRKAKRHAITLEEVQRQLPVYWGVDKPGLERLKDEIAREEHEP